MNELTKLELIDMEDALYAAGDLHASDDDSESVTAALKERFRIKDLGTANWAFRKIKALQDKKADTDFLAQQELTRITAWKEKQNMDIERNIAFFESLIIDYFMEERAQDDRFKLSTPYGKVSSRKSDKWEYNEATLVESLKDAGLLKYIKVVESPEKAEIKRDRAIFTVTEDGQLITAEGLIIEGILVTKGETITVKAG